MVHTWIRHGAHVNETWHTYAKIRVFWHTFGHTCAMSHSHAPWLIHMCHDSFTCATYMLRMPKDTGQGTASEWVMERIWFNHGVLWLIHMCHDSVICAMTHSYVPWLIHTCHDLFICAMTHSYVIDRIWISHGTHMNESRHTWLSHVTHNEGVMLHITNESWTAYESVLAHVWMSHSTHMNESWHTYGWVMTHIWMSHVPHAKTWGSGLWQTNESCHAYESVMSHVWLSHGTHDWVLSPLMNESCRTCQNTGVKTLTNNKIKLAAQLDAAHQV